MMTSRSLCWLCAIVLGLVPRIAHSAQIDSARAVVLIYAKSLDASAVGHGFVVGDGTLVVTARHIILGPRTAGDHRTDAMIEVVSPYLGDACEAQLVADDRSNDLAVLRIPWKAHPALALSTTQPSNQPLIAVAYASAARAVDEGRTADLQGEITAQTKPLPVDPLWSGCPVLDPSNQLAGCWNGAKLIASPQIQKLIESPASQPAAASSPLAPQGKASEATRMFLWSWALSAAGKHEMSYFAADTFSLLRPGSALGHKNVAIAAAQLNQLDKAEQAYQRALKCDPQSISIRILYGQFLAEHNQPDKALSVLAGVWEPDQQNTIAVIPMCNLLARQGHYDRCVALLERATQRRPNDGFLWIYLAQNRRSLGQRARAGEAYATASRLMPERDDLAIEVAQEYEAAGQLDKAEQQYRKLAYQSAQIPAGHFLLARFLAKDPERRAEALEECEAALKVPAAPGAPPRDLVEKLARTIRERGQDASRTRFPTTASLRL